MIYHRRFLIIFNNLIFFTLLVSQELPQNSLTDKINNFYFDSGYNWEQLSHFGPHRYYINGSKGIIDTNQISNNKLNIISGLEFYNRAYLISLKAFYKFKDHFYIFLHPVLASDANNTPFYSGINRPKSRFGFKSGEFKMSGLGFENEWAIIQYGRGVQSWGAGNNIQISISHNSQSYDYGLIGLKMEKLRFRYFHGFLENINNSNRYIVGKGLEYNNFNNLILSLSEILIYSGNNRPIDISYINPVSSHLEVELNDRQNLLGTDSGNAIWQFSFDYYKNKFRISSNFIIDELVIDKEERENGHNHFLATSFKLVYSLNNISIKNLYGFNIFAQYISVGKNTFRHETVSDINTGEITGYNNFVSRGFPLGWQGGSHSDELKIGINYLRNKIHTNIFLGFINSGQHSILDNPYLSYDLIKNYISDESKTEQNIFFGLEFDFLINEKIRLFSDLKFNSFNKTKNENFLKIALEVSLKNY
jgi:hypothetical protein